MLTTKYSLKGVKNTTGGSLKIVQKVTAKQNQEILN
jgi:hypothetical protein